MKVRGIKQMRAINRLFFDSIIIYINWHNGSK